MLQIHRNNRMERLLDELAGVLSQKRRCPFAPEVVLVQSLGMERWLSMGLAQRFGVWTNAQHPFPRAFIEWALDAVLGPVADSERWTQESMTLHLASLLGEIGDEPEFRQLGLYLSRQGDVEARLELASRIADAFDQAQIYRPEWLLDWSSEAIQFASTDFRPLLFKRLKSRLGPNHFPARVERLVTTLAEGHSSSLELPERISLFAVAALPPMFLRVFDALSSRVSVHWCLLTASEYYLGDELVRRELARLTTGSPALEAVRSQPLLVSFGRLMRDTGRLLEQQCQYEDVSVAPFVEPEPGRVLMTLQADLASLRHRGVDATAPRLPLSAEDDSLQVHVCHGPRRELEVLRELLLSAFERDPSLMPEDCIVLLRDVEVYAPLVAAVFDAEIGKPGRIPYNLSDRTVGSQNPLLDAMTLLLDTCGRRLTVVDFEALLECPAILARFAIEPAALRTISAWFRRLGMRWAVDDEERRREGLPPQPEHTLGFGLERLLLGSAMDSSSGVPFAGRMPFDVEGDEALLAGRLAECGKAVFAWRERLSEPQSFEQWRPLLEELIETLFVPAPDQAYQQRELRLAVESLVEQATAAGFTAPVPARFWATHLREHFEKARSARAVLSSGVTFCTMLPMRGIPARFVAMVGLDDGSFPRTPKVSSFDQIAREPMLGDRLLREEDRHLFLESLLAARERLVITYVGRSPRDDSPIPPSVVVEELLSVIDESFYVEDAARGDPLGHASERLVVVHPLHAHSPKYFDGSDRRLIEHSEAMFRAAVALRRTPQMNFSGLTRALPQLDVSEVTLAELVRFWMGPGEAFWETRLRGKLEREGAVESSVEPVEIDGLGRSRLRLEQWQALAASDDVATVRRRWQAEGQSPVGSLGGLRFNESWRTQSQLRSLFEHFATEQGEQLREIELLAAGVRITALLGELYGDLRLDCGVSLAKAKDVLGAWIKHLALCASGKSVTTWMLRPGKSGDPPTVLRYESLEANRALACLTGLVERWRLGMTVPLPFFPELSLSFCERLEKGKTEAEALEKALSEFGDPLGEQDDGYQRPAVPPEIARLYGDEPPLFDEWPDTRGLLAVPCFTQLAREVCEPLLEARRVLKPRDVLLLCASDGASGEEGA